MSADGAPYDSDGVVVTQEQGVARGAEVDHETSTSGVSMESSCAKGSRYEGVRKTLLGRPTCMIEQRVQGNRISQNPTKSPKLQTFTVL